MTNPISFVPTPTATSASTAASSAASLASNFDTFLTILTAQIQNQDPLEPMDSSKFTEQLVQYSQVEQQIASNKKLDTLATQLAASSSTGSLSYLGRTALFDTSSAALTDGTASWQYALDTGAQKTTLSVQDAKGNTVYTTTAGEITTGAHTFNWDGKRSDGSAAPDGVYKLVASAKAADNSSVETAIAVSEKITGVDFSSSNPAVTTASGSHALSTIMRIQETAS